MIAHSHGPSGANVDYLVSLAKWLRMFESEDAHVMELERRVLEILAEKAAEGQLPE